MNARLLISSDIKKRVEEMKKILGSHLTNGNTNHPDLLYIKAGEKLGIAEARKIKEHFSLKPYSAKGRTVIIEDASLLTIEAQNALLKTLEEPPKEAVLILGAKSDADLLPTILSRCQIIRFESKDDTPIYHTKYAEDLDKLSNSSIEDRFQYIEKLKDREEFLQALVKFFRQKLIQKITKHDAAVQSNIINKELKDFLKELLQAEEWAKQNVNIRAILEYLMLKIPRSKPGS